MLACSAPTGCYSVLVSLEGGPEPSSSGIRLRSRRCGPLVSYCGFSDDLRAALVDSLSSRLRLQAE